MSYQDQQTDFEVVNTSQVSSSKILLIPVPASADQRQASLFLEDSPLRLTFHDGSSTQTCADDIP